MVEQIKTEEAPKKKRVYHYTKEHKAKLKADKEERKRKLEWKKRKARLKKDAAKLVEEKLIEKRNADKWVERRAQYELFYPDCLIPRAQNEWTLAVILHDAYKLYCKAIGQPVTMSFHNFNAIMRDNFCEKRTPEGLFFGCVLKPGVFITGNDVVGMVPNV